MLCNMAYNNGEAIPLGTVVDHKLTHLEQPGRCDMTFPLLDGASGFSSAGISFGSWQGSLPDKAGDVTLGLGQWNSTLAFITMLRNPLDQALSHYKHVQEDFEGLFPNFEAFVDYGICTVKAKGKMQDMNACQAFVSTSRWVGRKHKYQSLEFAVFQENQQLRWLEPRGVESEIVKADLDAAKRRLELFDEVFILEEFHRTDRFRMKAYGWANLDDRADVENGFAHHHANATKELSAATIAKLARIQRWDLELYEHARALAKRQRDRRASARRE